MVECSMQKSWYRGCSLLFKKIYICGVCIKIMYYLPEKIVLFSIKFMFIWLPEKIKIIAFHNKKGDFVLKFIQTIQIKHGKQKRGNNTKCRVNLVGVEPTKWREYTRNPLQLPLGTQATTKKNSIFSYTFSCIIKCF